MAELLGSVSPDQLLMLMAVPVIGAVLLAGVLFVLFSSRMRKGLVKSEPPAIPVTMSFILPKQEAAPPVVASQAPTLESSPANSASPTELKPNLDFLDQRAEMEAEMMNLSKSSRENRTGLSARLGQQARSAPPSVPPTASQPAPAPVNPPAVGVNPPVSAPPEELLRLLRDPQSGQLMVEIAGQRYTKLAEIADKKVGQYILTLAAHLLAFTNGMIATDAGLKTLQAPKVGEAPMPLAAPTPASQPLPAVSDQPTVTSPGFIPLPPPDVEAAFLASLRAQSAKSEPPQSQRRGLFGRPKAAVEEPLLPTLNLAEQINNIAQTRLRYSPLATTTKLEITSDPGGGILINVNGAFYHGPDDIPQLEVKELIKASIQEWENS